LKIAVVILNWNGRNLLEKFIPSMVKYNSSNADLYVADNASSDDSIEFLKKNYPEVKIVQNSDNGGYARGYNQALKHIDADIYALVNSDIEVSENWLEPIIEIFENDENTSAVQPKILDYKDKSKFEFAGAAGGYIDMFGYPYCRGRVFTEIEHDKGQYEKQEKIFWASGACIFIRKREFDTLGGFDEDYFAHMEEIDLCWRIQNSGKKIIYQPKSIVYHVGGATLKESNPHKTYLNFRNSLFTILKNAPGIVVVPLILSRLFLDGIAGLKFLFDAGYKHTFAIVRSHLSFYSMFFKMLKKRRVLKKSKMNYFLHWSVVFKFYIQRRKYFKDL
jgi:GT2 family glycosyltransferase